LRFALLAVKNWSGTYGRNCIYGDEVFSEKISHAVKFLQENTSSKHISMFYRKGIGNEQL